MKLSSMRNSMEEELTRENDSEVRWKEYFVQRLNGDEISEEGEDVMGEDWKQWESS